MHKLFKLYTLNICVCILSHFSHIQLFATIWTVARQAPLSMRFSREEYWSGLPCSPPGDLSNPRIEPMSLMSPALASGFFNTSATSEAQSASVACIPNHSPVLPSSSIIVWSKFVFSTKAESLASLRLAYHKSLVNNK